MDFSSSLYLRIGEEYQGVNSYRIYLAENGYSKLTDLVIEATPQDIILNTHIKEDIFQE